MSSPIYNNYRVSGEWLYINDTAIQFDSEEQAREFLLEVIKREVLN